MLTSKCSVLEGSLPFFKNKREDKWQKKKKNNNPVFMNIYFKPNL